MTNLILIELILGKC